MRTFLLVAILLAVASTLCACPRRTFIVPPVPHDAKVLSGSEREALLGRMAASESKMKKGRLLARVIIQSSEGRYAFRYALVYKRPTHFRLEVLPVETAYTLELLTVREGSAVALSTTDKTATLSDDADRLLRRMLKIPLGIDMMVPTLLARVPMGEDAMNGIAILFDQGADRYYLDDRARGYLWVVSAKDLIVEEGYAWSTFDGSEVFSVKTSGRIELGGGVFPARLDLEIPQISENYSVRLTSADFDREIPEKLFDLSVPSGYTESRINASR